MQLSKDIEKQLKDYRVSFLESLVCNVGVEMYLGVEK